MPLLAFYASFAGLFTEPAGLFPVVNFPVGGSLNLKMDTSPTLTGTSGIDGNAINILDFGPATSQDAALDGISRATTR